VAHRHIKETHPPPKQTNIQHHQISSAINPPPQHDNVPTTNDRQPYPSESPQPGIQAFCTYVVIIHIQDDTSADDDVRVAGVFMNFKDAIFCLKNQRLNIEDGFIAPEDAVARDRHPFRNHIGHLERSDGTHIGWGYSWWREMIPDYTNRAWIQKTQLWRRGDEVHDIAELSEEELAELEAEGDIDYVALGQRAPNNGRFDEALRDFVFKGEKKFNVRLDKALKNDYSKSERESYKDYSGGSTDE